MKEEKVNIVQLQPIAQALIQKQFRAFFIMGMRTASNIAMKRGQKELAEEIIVEAGKFKSGNASLPRPGDKPTAVELREGDSKAAPKA